MQYSLISIATYGYYQPISGWLTALGIATEGFYGSFLVQPFGLLEHTIELREVNTNNPITNAIVDLFDSEDRILLRRGISGPDGKVLFAGLLFGVYFVRVAKLGSYNFSLNQIQVFEDKGKTIVYGEPIVLSIPSLPQLCRIHIFVVDFGLIPTKGLKVHVKILSLPQTLNGYVFDWVSKTFETDENGYVFFDAARKAKIFVIFKEAGIEREFIVPDQSSVNIRDLL